MYSSTSFSSSSLPHAREYARRTGQTGHSPSSALPPRFDFSLLQMRGNENALTFSERVHRPEGLRWKSLQKTACLLPDMSGDFRRSMYLTGVRGENYISTKGDRKANLNHHVGELAHGSGRVHLIVCPPLLYCHGNGTGFIADDACKTQQSEMRFKKRTKAWQREA